MKLHVTTASQGPGTPVVITHGLYGQGRNLAVLARHLPGRHVVLVDQRNHGASPWSDRHDYFALAEDLDGVIADLGGRADLVGHSMGGKAAMATALLQPERVRRLVVMDIAPIAYAHDQMQYVRAMQGLDLNGLTSRAEADRRLAAVLAQPMLRGFFLQSLDLRADPPRWRLNLDVLAASMATLTGWPEDMPAGTFTGPALFLYGAASDYVTSPEAQAAVRRHFPQAKLQALAGAGHWLHAEAPAETAAAVAAFLSD